MILVVLLCVVIALFLSALVVMVIVRRMYHCDHGSGIDVFGLDGDMGYADDVMLSHIDDDRAALTPASLRYTR
jgi:hypothetical protein